MSGLLDSEPPPESSGSLLQIAASLLPLLKNLVQNQEFKKLTVVADKDNPLPQVPTEVPFTLKVDNLAGDSTPRDPPDTAAVDDGPSQHDLQGVQDIFQRRQPSVQQQLLTGEGSGVTMARRTAQEPSTSSSAARGATMQSLPAGEFSKIGMVGPPGVAPEKVRVDFANKKRMPGLRQSLNSRDPHTALELTSQYMAEAVKPKDHMNPNTRRFYENVLFSWSIIIDNVLPGLDPDRHWSSDIVTKYAAYYLIRRVAETRGRHGHDSIHAYTLLGWLTALSWLIARFCFDPTTNFRNGMTILAGGLYAHLDATVHHLIQDRKLRRHLPKKQFLYRVDVQRLIEAALTASNTSGRIVKLQLICAIILVFYTAARPGTLVGNNPKDRKVLERYLKLGDFVFHRESHCVWNTQCDFFNYKGYGGGKGLHDQYNIFPPGKAHNSIFGCFWLIIYMFLRGAFHPKYETIEDIINDDAAKLEVMADKADEPFFLCGLPGGRWLDEETKIPPSGTSLTGALAELGFLAGYSISLSLRMLRRGTADIIGLILGAKAGAMVLAHMDAQSTFKVHYSGGVSNVAIAQAVLGELQSDDVTNELLRFKTSLSLAVLTLMRCNAVIEESKRLEGLEEPEVSSDKFEWTETEKQNLKDHEGDADVNGQRPLVGSGFLHAVASAHQVWFELLPPATPDKVKTLDKTLATIEEIAFQPAHTRKSCPIGPKLTKAEELTYGTAQLPPDAEEGETVTLSKAARARATLEQAVLQRRGQHTRLRRICKERGMRERNQHRGEAFTTADRDSAVKDATAPSKIFLAAAGASSSSSVQGSTSNTSPETLAVSPDLIESCVTDITVETPGQVWQPETVEKDDDLSRDMGYKGTEGTTLRKLLARTRGKIEKMDEAEAKVDEAVPEAEKDTENWNNMKKAALNMHFAGHDQSEPDVFKDVTVGDVTAVLMVEVLKPYYVQLEQRRLKKEEGGFTCPECLPLLNHPLTRQVLEDRHILRHVWPTPSAFSKHNKWHSKGLRRFLPELVREGSPVFHCIAPGCDVSRPTLKGLQKHVCDDREKGCCQNNADAAAFWKAEGVERTVPKGPRNTSGSSSAVEDDVPVDQLQDDPLTVAHIEVLAQVALLNQPDGVRSVLQTAVDVLNDPSAPSALSPRRSFPTFPDEAFEESDNEDDGQRKEVYELAGTYDLN